jgi:hypothetical protein
MGCDYYIRTELVVEYNNNEKKYILLSESPRYLSADNDEHPLYYYEWEAIKKETETKILYENCNWINPYYANNYNYYLEEDKTNVKTIKKVVSGYPRG